MNNGKAGEIRQTDAPWELPGDSIALVGLFNPDILAPFWVLKFIFPEEALGDSGTQMGVGRGAPGIVHRAGVVYWRPTRNRLTVNGPPAKTGYFVSKVLELLPHAPVIAAGVNFVRFGEVDVGSGPFRFDPTSDSATKLLSGRHKSTSHAVTVVHDDGVALTVKVAIGDSDHGRAMVDFNYHLDAHGDDDLDKAEQLRAHVERAEEFSGDAERIMRGLVNG